MIFDIGKIQINWQSHPFDIYLNQGNLVGWIRTGEGCMRVGGLSKVPYYLIKYSSRWVPEKGDGLEPPYKLCIYIYAYNTYIVRICVSIYRYEYIDVYIHIHVYIYIIYIQYTRL